MKGYDDGSPEQIKKFVDSVRSTEVSDEFVDVSFEILPDGKKSSVVKVKSPMISMCLTIRHTKTCTTLVGMRMVMQSEELPITRTEPS